MYPLEADIRDWRLKGLAATPESITRNTSAEWSNQEIPEFVPQGFQQDPISDIATGSSILDPFQSYDGTSAYPGIEDTSTAAQINPYAQDATGTGAAAFFHQPGAYTQPLQYHLYAPIGPHRENLLAYQRTAHDFFISETLRQDLQRKCEATLQVLSNSNLPANIEHFHTLVPLDTSTTKNNTAFGYNSYVYKAISSKDGYHYVLRRLEGFRLTSDKAIRTMHAWKRVNAANIVTVHDCFTSRAFGDSSLVFVSDYHPMSKTLAEHHFTSLGQYHTHGHRNRQSGTLIPEQVLWSYITQLTCALKTIHQNGLAARGLLPSKILLTDKNRLRINSCGILDVVAQNPSSTSRPSTPSLQDLQADDLRHLGRLILNLSTSNPNTPTTSTKPIESLLPRTYTDRLKSTVSSLITGHYPDITAFAASISDHLLTTLDTSQLAHDTLRSTLARELENSRLVRLLVKLGNINERPEYSPSNPALTPSNPNPASTTPANDPAPSAWSETGERYYLKLFRDYVFHQVGRDGRPVLDLGHVVSCLNKLDAGSEERVCLVSRDEQNVFVVSYREVRRGVEGAWAELVRAGAGVR
ncbi:MAG: PAB-dependent poly(A)-specific ribonuclease subunit 3 [Chrysothrix sp. TS-e1954]|nr:MAG: PAB-dependent poly(A)-specific ribonuclease subunit 3 [Chrysothrix sp. TS-e1954]